MQIRKSLTVVISATLILDQLSKWLALEHLENGRVVELFWTLQMRLVRNAGVSFGKGNGLGQLISVVVVLVIIVLLKFALNSKDYRTLVLYGLIIGGALGNLADRIFRESNGFLKGEVVDFIDFQWWPVFNIADSAVVVGCLLLAVNGLRFERV
jgi:signal peptidase II